MGQIQNVTWVKVASCECLQQQKQGRSSLLEVVVIVMKGQMATLYTAWLLADGSCNGHKLMRNPSHASIMEECRQQPLTLLALAVIRS